MKGKGQLDLLRPRRRRHRRPKVEPATGSVPAAVAHKRASHLARPVFSPRHPLHITYRVKEDIGRLRRRDVYAAIKRALRNCCAKPGFRICHFSVQGNHLHLIVEASDKGTLGRGMQGFGISAAKQINRVLDRRKGQVFTERYGCKVIVHPKQVRATLAYVLNNWRKHSADSDAPRYQETDWFSSAPYLDGWTHRKRWEEPVPVGATAARPRWRPDDKVTDDDGRPLVAAPLTPMLAREWRRYGLIMPREVPAS
jgi:putative transposase